MKEQITRKEFTFIMEQELRIERYDPICLALSGGIDSMVLASLLKTCDFYFSVAHCNFKLRGEESEEDALFIKKWCIENQIPLHSTEFETSDYADEKSISIEMAARELRYNWFDTIIEENNYQAMLVAHHRDDSLETFLLNIARGTGIRGLTGINAINGYYKRPLLAFSREQIVHYGKLHEIPFREDKSNASVVYRRNKVRHHILPELDQLNPAFRSNMMRTMEHLQQIQDVAFASIKEQKLNIIEEENPERFLIRTEKLLCCPSPQTFLFEYINPLGFHGTVCKQIIASIEQGESGKEFFSETHRILFDRSVLIVTKIQEKIYEKHVLSAPYKSINSPIELHFEEIEMDDSFELIRDKSIAYIDLDKIGNSMQLRHWLKGDTFRPLGMKGKKKLSDFFINQKFSLIQKEECWILTHNNDIVWIVGHRMDDLYKVTPHTKNILKIVTTQV